jgi:hypothetical protein
MRHRGTHMHCRAFSTYGAAAKQSNAGEDHSAHDDMRLEQA